MTYYAACWPLSGHGGQFSPFGFGPRPLLPPNFPAAAAAAGIGALDHLPLRSPHDSFKLPNLGKSVIIILGVVCLKPWFWFTATAEYKISEVTIP